MSRSSDRQGRATCANPRHDAKTGAAHFLRRVTAPDAHPLTDSAARQFLSNAGRRLSATEAQNLPPQGRKYLAQFAKALDEAIQSTAEDAGVLDEYNAAIKEYRQGMT